MATIKSFTSLEQSKMLAKILQPESADMCWEVIYASPKDDIIEYTDKPTIGYIKHCLPAWSLAALLNILDYPQLSKDKIGDRKVGWMVSVYLDNCRYDSIWYDNPIDACVTMIEKLHELKML